MTATAPECNALRLLFENSPDAVWLLDGQTGVFVDCNETAVAMMRAKDKSQLLQSRPADFSPELQPDGRRSSERAAEVSQEVQAQGSARFEWLARRLDGELFPMEVVSAKIQHENRDLRFVVCRDITERKQAEAQIQELNQQLEKRVRERTIELEQANEQLKAEIRQRRRKEKIQQAIYQISQAVLTASDLDSFYRQVHGTVQGLMRAKNFYLALRERGKDLVAFPYFVDEVDPPPRPMTVTTGLTGYVLRTGQPLLVNRQTRIRKKGAGVAVLSEPSGETAYLEAGSPCAVWLGVPLTVRGEAIGVMAVQDYQNESAYGEEEKQILGFVAEQTALAIERKRAEQSLRESEEKHRALFEASSQGVMLHDDEKFLEVNPATLRILGYASAEEIIGKHPAQTSAPIQPSGERAEVLADQHIRECLETGSTRFEWLARRSKGDDVPIEVILNRIETGGRRMIQAVINDITERKRAENELLKALAREKELGQLKSSFVSTVSHEFRTPLGIIMSSAQILADYFDKLDTTERRENLLSIQKNARQMASLMEEVLILSQVEAGKMEFKAAELSLSNFCRRLTDEVLSSTNRRCPVRLTVDSSVDEIQADERLLRHIFTNLLTNAVKYSPPGNPVEFQIQRDGPEIVWQVQDRGVGIPEPDRERLFDAFHRGRNVGTVPGTGLGLTIVKRCLELHRGRIKIESVVDQGTTVTVRLPVFAIDE